MQRPPSAGLRAPGFRGHGNEAKLRTAGALAMSPSGSAPFLPAVASPKGASAAEGQGCGIEQRASDSGGVDQHGMCAKQIHAPGRKLHLREKIEHVRLPAGDCYDPCTTVAWAWEAKDTLATSPPSSTPSSPSMLAEEFALPPKRTQNSRTPCKSLPAQTSLTPKSSMSRATVELERSEVPSQLLVRRSVSESRLGPLSVSTSTRASAGERCASIRRPPKAAVLDTVFVTKAGVCLPARGIRQLREDEKIFDLYYWEEVLQEVGDGGKVVVCRPKAPSTSSGRGRSRRAPEPGTSDRVMKIRAKVSIKDVEKFRTVQLRMLNFPPHEGVMPIHEVLEDDRFFYIVMQKATGGSFFYALLAEYNDGVMPSPAVRGLMREILAAVSHVHRQGMLHRDIKPDNLVMTGDYDDALSPTGISKGVALIDFDHADPEWSPDIDAHKEAYLGTMRFNAPETFRGEFSVSSDLYSVGVILYLLMSGQMPYSDAVFGEGDPDDKPFPRVGCGWRSAVYDQMRQASIDFSIDPWPAQPLCKDFCSRLLAFHPCDRPPSADAALMHEWLFSLESP